MDRNVDFIGLTDAQLVTLARLGGQDAFGELVQRHRQKCVDIAGYILKDRGEAEDQAQNALVNAFRHLDQYHSEALFSTWLMRIVSNQCLMALRARKRSRMVYLDQPPTDPQVRQMELPAAGPDPEGNLAAQQMIGLLRAEMRRIPPLLRKVMELRDVEQLPMIDVADRLGITVQAAKSRLFRARIEMRSRLSRHKWINSTSAPLSRVAAPLDRVGRQYATAHRALAS
jgi:RNA polymerase sigma-70 factor, ECF subfamily